MFVDDPFCMFLKIRCKLDSYADVVFSRASIGKPDCMWLFYTFKNELLCENSFLPNPSQERSPGGMLVILKD